MTHKPCQSFFSDGQRPRRDTQGNPFLNAVLTQIDAVFRPVGEGLMGIFELLATVGLDDVIIGAINSRVGGTTLGDLVGADITGIADDIATALSDSSNGITSLPALSMDTLARPIGELIEGQLQFFIDFIDGLATTLGDDDGGLQLLQSTGLADMDARDLLVDPTTLVTGLLPVMVDSNDDADCTSSVEDLSGLSSWRRFSTALSSNGCTCNRLSTNRRYPAAVGTRPAEVWGECRKPRSSRSDMTLRMVAALTGRPASWRRVADPTGWPSRMCRSTSTFSRVNARSDSSELAIPSLTRHLTRFYHSPRREKSFCREGRA